MNELVILRDNKAITTSLQIAEVFDKRHDNVLKDIEDLATKDLGAKVFFAKGSYSSRGKEYPQFFMERDGFTLLAMGYNGAKALEFKLKYISAFNEMEKKLKIQAPTNMKDALLLALAQQEELETKNQIIGELKPKADYMDRILKSKSLVTITQIAKDYGMSGQSMNALLKELRVQYKQSDQWLLYSNYQSKGYTHSETFVVERVNGINKTAMNTKWTQKGRLFLYDLLKENDVIPVIEREC